jgi:hypothetical protein
VLLTSRNPGSEFSLAIREFSRHLASLGEALSARQLAGLPSLLEHTMTAWMEFSNRFGLNPPPEARGDQEWPNKIRQAGEALGQIRMAMQAGEIQTAHDRVLALSGTLGSFFTHTELSPTRRAFLQAAEAFTNLERSRLARDLPAIGLGLASVSHVLNDLDGLAGSASRPLLQPVHESLTQCWSDAGLAPSDFLPPSAPHPPASMTALSPHPEGTVASFPPPPPGPSPVDFDTLGSSLSFVNNRILELRARMLLDEWFPNLVPAGSPPVPALASPSPGGAP